LTGGGNQEGWDFPQDIIGINRRVKEPVFIRSLIQLLLPQHHGE
jgi:hypothetical protein